MAVSASSAGRKFSCKCHHVDVNKNQVPGSVSFVQKKFLEIIKQSFKVLSPANSRYLKSWYNLSRRQGKICRSYSRFSIIFPETFVIPGVSLARHAISSLTRIFMQVRKMSSAFVNVRRYIGPRYNCHSTIKQHQLVRKLFRND